MKYSKITTEKIKDNLWISRTVIEDTPLKCKVSIEANSKEEAIRKMEIILADE